MIRSLIQLLKVNAKGERHGAPLSAYINGLIVLCLLPLVLLAIYLAVDHIHNRQIEANRDAENLGKGISFAVDQHLLARIGGLQMLAASPLIEDMQRHRELYESAKGFLSSFGSHVVLADPDMQMLFNTRTEFGARLPKLPRPRGHSAVETALRTLGPATGDIFLGPIAKENLVAIAVPVFRNATPRFLLLTPFETRQFEPYLNGVQLPEGWIITLRDGSEHTIAQRVPEGVDKDVALQGAYRYVFPSSLSPWTTVIEIPRATYLAPMVTTATILITVIVLITVGSFVCGRWASRKIAGAVAALAREARDDRSHLQIFEVAEVRLRLDQATRARDLAESTLVQSKERAQRFFQDAPLPLGIITLDGQMLDINERFIQVFGYTLMDLPDVATWWELACPELTYRAWVKNSWSASVAHAERQGCDIASAEYRITCKNGAVRILTISGIVLGSEVLVTFFDITERRHSEERFTLAMEATSDGLWDLNVRSRQTFLTPRFYEITGYRPGQMNADIDFLRHVVHPEDWMVVCNINMQHLQGDTTVSAFDFRLVTATGEVRWMEGRAKVVEWENTGRPLRILGVMTDIGKRKQVEKELRDSEAFAKSVLDSVASHIAVLDRSGFILAVNAPWQKFSSDNGQTPGKSAPRTGVGVNYLEICRGRSKNEPDGGQLAREGILAVLAREVPSFSMEYPCHSPDQQRWFLMFATPLGEPGEGAVIVHTDITSRKHAEIERKRANALANRLAVFADAAVNYALVILDAAGDVVEWNKGAEFLTHISRKLALGRRFDTLFTEQCREANTPSRYLEMARTHGSVSIEEYVVRGDRSQFFASGTLYCLHDGAENANFSLVLSDITASQQAALLVAESEARLSAVINAASDAIVSTDAQGTVQLFNPAAERIFQVPSADMMGKTLDRLMPATIRSEHHQYIHAFSTSDSARRAMGAGKVKAMRADGQVIELEASISKAVVGGQMALTAILRDVTERTRAERALVQYQIQLAGLTHRLLAQEKETTQRLAQALHDELGQTLAAMRLIFEAESKSVRSNASLDTWVDRMERLIHEANRQARQVLIDLRPPLLDELGLHAALDNELRQRERNHEDILFGLKWDVMPEKHRWSADVEYAAFMVTREALNNALLHATPQLVEISVSGNESHLRLRIADDGLGIADLDTLLRSGHLGLIGMRERAVAIGAKLDIQSSPESGTTVTLNWGAA